MIALRIIPESRAVELKRNYTCFLSNVNHIFISENEDITNILMTQLLYILGSFQIMYLRAFVFQSCHDSHVASTFPKPWAKRSLSNDIFGQISPSSRMILSQPLVYFQSGTMLSLHTLIPRARTSLPSLFILRSLFRHIFFFSPTILILDVVCSRRVV